MKKYLLMILLIFPLLSICQPVTIHGKVVNEEGLPVVNAGIAIKSSQQSTLTNEKGEFTIYDLHLGDTIIVTAVGYQPAEQLNNIHGEVIIVLRRAVKSLEEVIINTGYTSLPKERATGSFEKINNGLLNRKVSSDWLSRLEGISGVYFDRRTTLNGTISIRGRSTIYANAVPLIVLDNFPYDGDIDNINPNDIENITILKDAAAASIWGVRAGNGVIVISTKKGKQSKKPSLELNTNITTGTKPDLFYSPDYLPASDFIDVELLLFGKGFYNSAINNTTSRPPISPVVEILAKRRAGLISPADSMMQIDALRNSDIRNDMDRFFYRPLSAQQYSLNYSGGSQYITYLFSAGYDRSLSNLVRNNNDRYTFRSSVSYTPFNAFQLNLELAYTHSSFQNNNPGSISTGGGKNLYPYAKLVDAYGNPAALVKDYRIGYIDTAGAGKLLDWKYRPLEELALANNSLQQSDIRFNLSASYKISKYFSTAISFLYEKQTLDGKNLYAQDAYFTRNLINRFYNPAASNKYAVPLGGIIDLSESSVLSQNGRAQLNYNRSWNNAHEITAIAGTEIRDAKSNAYNYRTYGYSDDVLTYNNVNYKDNLPIYGSLASAQPVPNPAQFGAGSLRFVSLYANAAYTYLKRYTVSASARKDASNLFGVNANQKWVPLWSSGFSWLVNREKFYHSGFLPYLKLRVTYGYNGNLDNTLSAYTTIRYTSNAQFTSQQYALLVNPPNPDLRWEKLSVWNIGIDFALKNDRISGTIDLYRKKGKDLIGFSPVDPTTGVRNNLQQFSFKGNVADMTGKGIELSLNSQNLTGAFKWNSTLIFAYVTSKVTQYNLTNLNAAAFLSSGIIVNPIPGKPLYTIYSFPWAGLDPATGDPQGYLNGAISKNYTSLSNLTVDKLTYHGSAVPVTYGSLLNTFEWKHISLSANVIYKLGYYFRRSSVSYSNLFTAWSGHQDYIDRWQKPGDENNTNVPSLIYPANSSRDFFYGFASPLVEKGDHIRLQDISLSYNIINKNKRSALKNITVYGYINNIGILWKANKAGLDPDYFSGGYPLPRTFSLGIKTIL